MNLFRIDQVITKTVQEVRTTWVRAEDRGDALEILDELSDWHAESQDVISEEHDWEVLEDEESSIPNWVKPVEKVGKG
jgi:hypothetical protein